MKFQSIISFFALYLVSGLSAQINNNQSYQDIEYSNLQPGISSSIGKMTSGGVISGSVAGKIKIPVKNDKQTAATGQKKLQAKGQKSNLTGNQPTKPGTNPNVSKKGSINQSNGVNRSVKASQPTIINRSQPTRVYKPNTGPGNRMYHPAIYHDSSVRINPTIVRKQALVSNNLLASKDRPKAPVRQSSQSSLGKGVKPNTNPKRTTNGPKKQ